MTWAVVLGFQKPTGGSVTLNGKAIKEPGTDLMVVFQNYALDFLYNRFTHDE